MKARCLPAFLLLCALPASLGLLPAPRGLAADWMQFRGPGGVANSPSTNLPAKWSLTENLLWRTELPGLGTSSPITVGDKIYLTAYSGYGVEPSQGDMADLMRHVVCLDRTNGQIVWTKDFAPRLPESDYSGGNNSRHGYASSTIASDGEHLYVFFGKSGVYCLDLDGKEIWRTLVGDGTRGWGSSNSPVLYKDTVIINASIESGRLLALDKKTGETRWEAEEQLKGSWNTPILVDVEGGKQELVVCVPETILGVDPDTGATLWTCDGIPDRGYVCPSAIVHDGVVYAIGGRKNTAIAVRAGGRGDVTETHMLWETPAGSNVSSPIYHDGHLYWMHESRGAFNCIDAKTGELVFSERVEPRPGLVYSSVTFADGKVIAVSQYDGAFVLAAKPEFELISHNTFAGDDARANACPVVDGQRLLLRNDKYLYCIGTK
ncbi:MAG: PQQ-binding-like beta-propeller repeat protein [Pirellulaceae bacterium]